MNALDIITKTHLWVVRKRYWLPSGLQRKAVIALQFVWSAAWSCSGDPEVLRSHFPAASLSEGSSVVEVGKRWTVVVVGGKSWWAPRVQQWAALDVYGEFPLDWLAFAPYRWLSIMTITPGYTWQKPKLLIAPLKSRGGSIIYLSVSLFLPPLPRRPPHMWLSAYFGAQPKMAAS